MRFFSIKRLPPKRWLFLLAALALLLALHQGSWPAIWRLVVLPQADGQRFGMEVVTHGNLEGKGRDLASQLAPTSFFRLERSQASQVAYAVWRVAQTGFHDLRLECDDYGSLYLDHKPLLALRQGLNALNQGQARVFLEAGPHLLKLELGNLEGQGWMRLLVRAPGQEEFSLLGGQTLQAVESGNYRAWLKLADRLERLALGGLALLPVAAVLLWALGAHAAIPSGTGARLRLAGFLAAVLLMATVSSWYTVTGHVRWLDWASGNDYLANEEWDWHRAMVENRHSDHRAYRVLPDYVLAGYERLSQGSETDPSPSQLLFGLRYLIDFLIFTVGSLYYRRLGLSRPAVILGLALLTWAMYPTHYRNGLNFASFLDVVFFVLAGLLVIEGRLKSLVALSALAALNKETSILIPVLPLAAAWRWRPRLSLPRRELVFSGLALGVWLAIYGCMHLILGWGIFNKPHDRPGVDFLVFNLFQDPDSWRQLYVTLGVLPFLALACYKRSPLALRRFFLAVAPIWLLVHTIIAFWSETRLYMPPMAMIFIPMSLFALSDRQVGQA